MTQLPIEDGITRFKGNEERVDVFVNDPLNAGKYITNETTPRQVETLPHLVDRIAARHLQVAYKNDWGTGIAYSVNDLVKENSVVYICITAHTSGTFATDLADGKWNIFQANDVSNLTYTAPFTSAVEQNLSNVLKEKVSVKNFGAVGDGLTDDTAAIQAAVDAVNAAGGGTIFFPRGVYRLAESRHSWSWADYTYARVHDGIVIKSDVTFEGEGDVSVLRADTYLGAIIHTHLDVAITTDEANLKNIHFKNIRFEKPTATWAQECPLVYLESCENFSFINCTFYGFSGDGLTCGPVANVVDGEITGWLPCIMKNGIIANCRFDGITKDNRNALTLCNGQSIEVYSNVFKNCTRADMPGAIDIETESTNDYIKNIMIHDNEFYNVGGMGGVICVAVTAAIWAENIHIYNNVMRSCTNSVACFARGKSGTATTLPALDAGGFNRYSFTNNQIINHLGYKLIQLEGVTDCVVSNNTFDGSKMVSSIGTTTRPVINLSMTNNTFKNIKIISSEYDAFLNITGNLIKADISNNSFLNCGIWTDASTPLAANAILFVNTVSLLSDYVSITNNTISGFGTVFPSTTIPFICAGTLTNASRFLITNNRILGASRLNHTYSMTRYCNLQDELLGSTDWNSPNVYDDTTLPRSFKMGISITKIQNAAMTALTGSSGGVLAMTIRPMADPDQSYHTTQILWSYGANTKIWQRHGNVGANTWGTWSVFTGV